MDMRTYVRALYYDLMRHRSWHWMLGERHTDQVIDFTDLACVVAQAMTMFGCWDEEPVPVRIEAGG